MLGIAVNNEIAIVLDHRARIRENNLNTLAVVSGVNTQGHPFGTGAFLAFGLNLVPVVGFAHSISVHDAANDV